MIHRVVLNEDRVAILKCKFREGDIVVLTDDTGERTFIIDDKPTQCEHCPFGMFLNKCHMTFHYRQEGSFTGNLPCSANFLDGYDASKPGSSGYPISYKQIDTIMENL